MRPCAAACLRGHTTWLGGVAAWFDGGFPWCRAGARSHTFRVADGRFGDPAPSTVWLRKALRLARTHCAHPLARRPRVLVARQHAVSEPTSLTCGTWTGKRLPDHTLGPPHGARALVVHARARRVGRGGNERAHTARAIASRGRIGGGARCTPRGRGRRPRAVAVSLAREDHTTTPRWRARAKNCVLRRGRPVSRIGQKNQTSATCEPSTLQRTVRSCPSSEQRSARASVPRRARTRLWKWAG